MRLEEEKNAVGRDSFGRQLEKSLLDLASRAEKIASMLAEKLEGVMREATPTMAVESGIAPREMWPPLLSSFREAEEGIARSLDRIEDAILRTEL